MYVFTCEIMGVNIGDIAKGSEIKIEYLRGKTIAVDAFNTMYQFLSIIRDRETGDLLKDGKGRITSHLSGIFYRNAKLIQAGIKLVYVFDGKIPEFKRMEKERREEQKRIAEIKLEKAKVEGRVEDIKKYAQATARIGKNEVEDAKKLLNLMGIPYIDAPSEGEAQAAYMARKGIVYAVASQDYDSLLFGAPKLLRNVAITGKRKLPNKNIYVDVNPEIVELNKVLINNNITYDQLIIAGILIGTDYNPGGIKGIGVKKAIEIVKKYKNIEEVEKNVEWNFEISLFSIFNFFKNPPVEDIEIKKNEMDVYALKNFMLEHDFSEERINRIINVLRKASSSLQTGLNRWLK